MAKKNSKNDALEALDFIIDVLKEHEKDLDRLIHQLGVIADSIGEAGEITERIDKIEERLSTLHSEITNLITFVSSPREALPPSQGFSVTVRCNQWQDFKGLAGNAETVTYLLKDAEKTFQTDAMKEGKLLTYVGEFPQNAPLLKVWLSKELGVPEEKIFEGILSTG